MAIKIVKEINLCNAPSDTNDTSPERAQFAGTSGFNGSLTCYFEAAIYYHFGDPVYETDLYLKDSAESTTYATLVFNTGLTVYERARTTISSPPSSPTEMVVVRENGNIKWYFARILILQDAGSSLTATETQIEIGSYETGRYGTEAPLTYPKHWRYVAANWNGTTIGLHTEVVYEALSDKYPVTVKLQGSSDQVDWYDAVTIVNGGTQEAPTRVRVACGLYLTDGYYYRLVASNTATKASYGYNIYCGKIIARQYNGSITKTECNHLLANCKASGTGLQHFDQYYDPANWDGITINWYHEALSVDYTMTAKLQEDPNGTPSDITNSSITTVADKLTRGASAMTMPSSAEEIDCYFSSTYGCMSRMVAIVEVSGGLQTIVMDSLSLTAGHPALSVVPGLATIIQDSLGLSSVGVGLKVAPTLLMDSLELSSSPPNLTVVPGLATIILDSGVLSATPPTITVVPGLATLSMGSVGLTAVPPNLSVVLALTILMDSLGLTASPQALSVIPGVATLNMSSAALAATPPNLFVAPTILMDSLGLTSEPVTLSVVPGVATILMDTATLGSSTDALGVVPGLATIIADSLELLSEAVTSQVVPGLATLIMSTATLNSVAPDISLIPGLATVIMGSLGLQATTPTIIVIVEGGPQTIILNSLGLVSTPPNLGVVPGLATIPMDSLELPSVASTLSIEPGLATLIMDSLGIDVTGATISVEPGAVTVELNSLPMNAQAVVLTVVGGEAPSGGSFYLIIRRRRR